MAANRPVSVAGKNLFAGSKLTKFKSAGLAGAGTGVSNFGRIANQSSFG